ncbi:hypothetical protein SBRCBS47491_003233 [Sporothrix bragantina]|uniref:Heterokaryon incompatibility domain-containing protein n=1 Tax=Sporothrix bragantina TaxID=671064 RepID=A0ABP0BDU6_9PEZI
MRLINTSTLELVEYYPPDIPSYAILSHTWGPSEVTLQEYQSNSRKSGAGYRKIMNMVRVAQSFRHKFIWVDTCCIDKTNNSELSEAINSMYQWYRDAAVCVAYLEDVPSKAPDSALFKSRWFTRGWTLQELVAPKHVYFYDGDWVCRGPKTAFVNEILKRTNIPHRILAGLAEPTGYSLARRMSWAAGRETKRVEDIAYCLLGILDVNMPLLYGEGRRSFRRLQEEILKRQSDLTIFAWRSPQTSVPAIHVTDATSGNGNGPLPVASKHAKVFQPNSPGSTSGRASPSTPRAASPATPSPNEKKRRSVSPSPSATSNSSRSATPSNLPLVDKAVPSPGSSTVSVATPKAAHKKPKRTEYCLFAPSPEPFAEFGSLHPFMDNAEGFTVTNRGIFVSGSVYLRLVYKPSPDGVSPGTNNYLLLLGTQNRTFIGIYLSKVGPNLFQRDWDLGIGEFKEEDVVMMHGFLVLDWHILIDQASSATTEMLRQSSIHIPSRGLGNEYVRLKDMAPTHLWDVQDRLFLRPKPYGWTRYDMVLAIKCAVVLRNVNIKATPDTIPVSKRVNFVVLCQYRHQQFDPKFMMFLEDDHPRETEMIMVRRAPNNSLIWPDLDMTCPHLAKLKNHVMVDVGEKSSRTGKWRSCWYRISTVIKKEKADFEYDEPELYKVYFDIEHKENYDPADATFAHKTDTKADAKEETTIAIDRKKPN